MNYFDVGYASNMLKKYAQESTDNQYNKDYKQKIDKMFTSIGKKRDILFQLSYEQYKES